LFRFQKDDDHANSLLDPDAQRWPNGNHLKSWVLEGSKEGNSWIEFDHQDGHGDLNS
jgi:hypothetical protein